MNLMRAWTSGFGAVNKHVRHFLGNMMGKFLLEGWQNETEVNLRSLKFIYLEVR